MSKSSPPRRVRAWPMLVGGLIAAVALAACGSSSSSSSSTSSAASSSTSASTSASSSAFPAKVTPVNSAQLTLGPLPPLVVTGTYAQHVQTPTDPGIAGPLSKKPPAGLTIYYLECALVTCETQAGYVKQAASVLGWKVKLIPYAISAEGIKAGMDTAVQDVTADPSAAAGVAASGFPESAYASELASLDKMGVPLVDEASGNPIGGGLIANLDTNASETYAAYMAEYIAENSGGKGKVVEFNTPDYPSQERMHLDFVSDLKKLCPGCTYSYQPFALTDIGPSGPNLVVTTLQRNPGTQYAVFGFAELEGGVPAALANAGLKPKLVVAGPEQSTYQEIIDGQVAMAAAQPTEEQTWCNVDALARYSVGDKVPPDGCTLPSQILTKSNTPTAWSAWPGVPGWKSILTKDWQGG